MPCPLNTCFTFNPHTKEQLKYLKLYFSIFWLTTNFILRAFQLEINCLNVLTNSLQIDKFFIYLFYSWTSWPCFHHGRILETGFRAGPFRQQRGRRASGKRPAPYHTPRAATPDHGVGDAARAARNEIRRKIPGGVGHHHRGQRGLHFNPIFDRQIKLGSFHSPKCIWPQRWKRKTVTTTTATTTEVTSTTAIFKSPMKRKKIAFNSNFI